MPRKISPRKLWFKFTISGQVWRVYTTIPTEDPDMLEVAESTGRVVVGLCLYADHIILIDSALPYDIAGETFEHEKTHAILEESGANRVVMLEIGLTEEKWSKVEELMIRQISPMVFDTNQRNNFTRKLPKLPRR